MISAEPHTWQAGVRVIAGAALRVIGTIVGSTCYQLGMPQTVPHLVFLIILIICCATIAIHAIWRVAAHFLVPAAERRAYAAALRAMAAVYDPVPPHQPSGASRPLSAPALSAE